MNRSPSPHSLGIERHDRVEPDRRAGDVPLEVFLAVGVIGQHRLAGMDPKERGRYRPLGRELASKETSLLFKALAESSEPRFKSDLYRIQSFTATRPGEVRCAHWIAFDLREGIWTQPGLRTRNQRKHILPLPDSPVSILEGMKHPRGEWVFSSPATAGPIELYSQAATIRMLFERGLLECTPFTPHDLRRTVATH